MESQQSADEKIVGLHQKAKKLLLSNIDDEEIVSELTKENIDPGYASLIIENVKEEVSDAENFRKEFKTGLCLTAGGLLLNIASYFFSDTTGNGFVIAFWGIVAFGITVITRAYILFKR